MSSNWTIWLTASDQELQCVSMDRFISKHLQPGCRLEIESMAASLLPLKLLRKVKKQICETLYNHYNKVRANPSQHLWYNTEDQIQSMRITADIHGMRKSLLQNHMHTSLVSWQKEALSKPKPAHRSEWACSANIFSEIPLVLMSLESMKPIAHSFNSYKFKLTLILWLQPFILYIRTQSMFCFWTVCSKCFGSVDHNWTLTSFSLCPRRVMSCLAQNSTISKTTFW